jgi:hypothetical protein
MGCLLLGFGLASLGQAQTYVLAPTADTSISETAANQNNGASTVLSLSSGRALLRFDQTALASAIGSGRLVSATLELSVHNLWEQGGPPVEAHLLTADWTEMGATWSCAIDTKTTNNKPDCATQWNGGTFAAEPSDTIEPPPLGEKPRFDVTADVAAFLAGTPNRGWLLTTPPYQIGTGQPSFTSREGTVEERPKLTVVVQPPDSEPPTVAITSPASGSFVNTPLLRVTGTVTDDGTVAGVTVNDSPATITGDLFTADVPLNEGANEISVRAVDSTGKESVASATVSLDTVSPEVTLQLSPDLDTIVGEFPPQVVITYTDIGAGLDLATFGFQLDGANVSCNSGPDSASCSLPALQSGNHLIEVQIRDRASNLELRRRPFNFLLDQVAPSVAISSPRVGELLNTRTVRVTGIATDDSGVTSITVNGQPAALVSGQFSSLVNLEEGRNELQVVAEDAAERQSSAAVTVSVDSLAPALTVETPKPGQKINHGSVFVTGSATDANGVIQVEVGGIETPLSDDKFEREVGLQEGDSSIVVQASDLAGNMAEVAVPVERFTLPQVEIDSPADLSYIASTTVEVRGSVSDPAAAVKVNGIEALVSGNTFVAQNVPLIEGGNILTATAISDPDRIGADSITVVRDLTPPHVAIYQPRDGAELFEATTTVSGLVNDIVAGTVNASEVTVTVNGRPAAVANRSFVAEGVPLAPGDNVLSVTATDEGGNTGHVEIRVRLEPATVPRVVVSSGNDQSGVIGTPLAQPLVVTLLDASGQPVSGKPVLFKVVSTDGMLDGGQRQVAVTTGPDGRAAVHFTLGKRAGVANQMVEATISRFRGPAVFRATALPADPSLIVVDAGNQQLGLAGHALPQPLVAAVTDAGFNRLAGVQVTFRVVRGRGQFQNRQQQITVATDTDGRAIVPFVLPPEEEDASHVVQAVISDLEGSPVATFVSYGRTAGEASQTSISGIVVDNSNMAVPGVTLRILDTALTAQTDDKGLFKIQPAPVGTVKLVVDGSTAARLGSWPDLEFVMTTISGRDNDLGMPIYLLPLDLSHGVLVDETRGGTLSLPDVPGFSMEILPGSVTFPNGSRSGLVSVTAVHSDKVPMVPNFGQQPRLIVTIQPAGARFDPPARLTLPNVEGFAPGTVTEFYSFDHDLGHFVSIGPATVSEDGSVIVSNPGVGILKAGWHCGGNPSAAGTPADCPPCMYCDGSSCVQGCLLASSSTAAVAMKDLESVLLAGQCTCDDHNDCTINDHCDGAGGCTGDPVEVRAINGACVAAINHALGLTADSNGPARVKWRAPSGNPSSGRGGSFSVTYSSEGSFVVTAMCAASSKTKNVSTGPDCASITPHFNEIEHSQPPDPANFGQVRRNRHAASYKGCVGGGMWCFRLEEFVEEHGIGFALPAGMIDISNANSPAIDAANCSAVITDLTPVVGAGPGGLVAAAPYILYVPMYIVEAHERSHVDDFRTRVSTPTMNQTDTFVRQTSNCTNCKSNPPAATFDSQMETYWNQNRTSYATGYRHEVRAYTIENGLLATLIQGIRARASAQGWPAACR